LFQSKRRRTKKERKKKGLTKIKYKG
jgi:hypothetical protein